MAGLLFVWALLAGLVKILLILLFSAGHTPQVNIDLSPCSCCCLGFHCGYNEDGTPKFPLALNFIYSIAGSCPQAATTTISGQMTYDPAFAVAGLTCAQIPDCKYFCQCGYTWKIADADIPHCGPYIGQVSLGCVIPNDPPPLDPKCTHSKYEQCYWTVFVFVFRTDSIIQFPPPCTDRLGFPPNWPIQSCVDCSWGCVEQTDPPPLGGCCCTCPPCFLCHISPGPGGCGLAPNPLYCFGTSGCYEVTSFTVDPPNPDDCVDVCDPSRSGGPPQGRIYNLSLRGCPIDPDTGLPQIFIKGCNPTSCPPDDDNTGDFFIHIPSACGNADYFQAACAA